MPDDRPGAAAAGHAAGDGGRDLRIRHAAADVLVCAAGAALDRGVDRGGRGVGAYPGDAAAAGDRALGDARAAAAPGARATRRTGAGAAPPTRRADPRAGAGARDDDRYREQRAGADRYLPAIPGGVRGMAGKAL